jgi:hypothetical protein
VRPLLLFGAAAGRIEVVILLPHGAAAVVVGVEVGLLPLPPPVAAATPISITIIILGLLLFFNNYINNVSRL